MYFSPIKLDPEGPVSSGSSDSGVQGDGSGDASGFWAGVVRSWHSFCLWARRRRLWSKLSGYLVVIFGLLLVTRVLREFVGSIPVVPTKISVALLSLSMLLAILVYRQTLCFLQRHELEQRDRVNRQRKLTLQSGIDAVSEPTRIARERHWRSQRATLWGVIAAGFLVTYMFGMMLAVRDANVTGDSETEETIGVVVPFVLPAVTKQKIADMRKTSTEPIDDILTDDGGYFAEFLPLEYPGYIYATVIPLYVLYAIFCMTITRSCAYLVAPHPRMISPAGKPGQEIEIGPADPGGKDGPGGTDGVDLVLEVIDEFAV